ncbi:mechanosensitive ion channel protein [Halobacteriales archaeon SW_10_68_16]|jgi:small-conductance mechanosensitive channel|nr:MAG: mechanosensitive ion channel protein [Halobacteriales archaeon SW_10_68_16]
MQALAAVLQVAAVPSRVRDLLERLTTTEGRLAVTVGVLVVTLAVALLLAPFVVRRLNAAVRRRMPAGRVSDAFDRAGDVVPTTLGGLVLRTLQLALFLLAVIALLVVWGLVDLAVEVLRFLGLSLPLLTKIGATLGLAFVGYVAADILRESIQQFAERSDRITDHQREIMLRVSQLGVIALVVATALTVWGVNLSGLLVGAGFLGIVVGLAARQTLGSLIAGFVLMFSRPFTIGDWVEVAEDEGIVTDITIVNTRLENFDGETVVIPNDRVANQTIVNRSERGHLRIKLDVGIDYEADPELAADVARDAIEAVKLVTDSPPPRVVRKSFGDSAIVLELRFWIDRPMPPRKWQAIDDVVGNVKVAFEAEDIKIPFPQRELSGRAETGGFRLAEDGQRVEGPRVDDPGVGTRSGSGSGSASDDQ